MANASPCLAALTTYIVTIQCGAQHDESSDFDEEEEEEEEEDDWLEGADDALGAEDEELARMITPP